MNIVHFLLAILVTIVWGFNFVVVSVGMEGISPLLLGFARLFLTSIPGVFFIQKPKVPFLLLLLYGFTMFAIQFGFMFMGIYHGVSPGLGAILAQFQVFFTLVLAVILFKEKMSLWQILGACVSISGIILVGLNVGGEVSGTGFALIIAGAASWGVGNIIAKKIGKVNALSLVIWGSLVAWPPLLLLSLFFEGTDNAHETIRNLSWISGGAVLYITLFSTLFGYCVWSWLLAHYPIATVAPFTLLVPIFGIASSVVFLGEPLQIWKIAAALLVLSGVCINMFGSRIQKRLITALGGKN